MSEDKPIFTPYDFIRYVAEVRNLPIDAIKVPQHLMFTYQRRAYEHAKTLSMENLSTGGYMAKDNPSVLESLTM